MAATERSGRRPGIRLGRWFGVPVTLSPSWLATAVLLTYALAPVFSPPRSPGVRHYALALTTTVLFAASVLAHELAHAAVSTRLGLPVRHVTLHLLGGQTEAAEEPRTAREEYAVAIAGPLASVLLGGAAAAAGSFGGDRSALARAAGLVALTNAVLAVVNLLPGLPLDGGRVVRAAVWHLRRSRAAGTRAGVRGGQAVALALAAVGLLRVGAGDQVGLLALLVGVFLWTSATTLGRRAAVLERLGALDVRALVRPALAVEASLPLAEALRRAVAAGRRLVVVDAAGLPAAVISGPALAAVPDRRRPWVTVADVARALEPGLVLDAGLDGPHLLERMRATPASEYLVRGPDGAVAGVLSAHDVALALESTGGPAA
ncbi:MAG TPA: site-2 protease family protein [Mycobacteriales bacterium]|jgi:Zn-dependent protease|nr:site-2 protease family protein [Mycobacteriales bacterium]